MRGRWALIALVFLLATSTFAGVGIKDRDWPNNAPMLALRPNGTGLLLLTDPSTGRNIEATALLRIAEQGNPGLLAAFGRQLFQVWLAEGRTTQRPDGSLDWGTQENFDDLNALLRAAVVTELRPYMNQIREQISPRDLERAVLTGQVHPIQLESTIEKTWYSPQAVVQPTVCVSVVCGPCGAGGDDGSGVCPGATSCVTDCEAPCSNCDLTIVEPAPQPPPSLECPDWMTDEECYPVEITRKFNSPL